jgi:uncharacterized protein
MPSGKPAGVRCVNLDDANRCRLWGTELYPSVCLRFRPEPAVCGESSAQALATIAEWEAMTRPAMIL